MSEKIGREEQGDQDDRRGNERRGDKGLLRMRGKKPREYKGRGESVELDKG